MFLYVANIVAKINIEIVWQYDKLDYFCAMKDKQRQITMKADRLMTKKEAAEFLQVSTRTLDRYCKAGTIKPITIGTMKRFTKQNLIK